jgi:hypothetical protein
MITQPVLGHIFVDAACFGADTVWFSADTTCFGAVCISKWQSSIWVAGTYTLGIWLNCEEKIQSQVRLLFILIFVHIV